MPEFFDLTDHDDFVAVLTLNRPPVNALSRAVFTELEETMASLNADSEARAVVITGGDKVFSAGVDIRELRAAPPSDAIPRNTWFQRVFNSIEQGRLPVVAAINGYALGGGPAR